MTLFEERGYDRTTVSDIVARAKLGDRTFFRYFSDKREVLFSGSDALEKLIIDAVARVPKTAAPLDVVLAAIDATSPMFEAGRAFARRRLALIASHPELYERELAKSTKLASTISTCLRDRGVSQGTAGLLAMTGMVLFQNALERWVNDAKNRDLGHHVRKAFAELRAHTARTGSATRRPRP
ncbi:Transcriptional regulator, TetR family protein [Minicystis rosea]|nr:Transcriptional regulator, TetR family protein [Minicystis rosea]